MRVLWIVSREWKEKGNFRCRKLHLFLEFSKKYVIFVVEMRKLRLYLMRKVGELGEYINSHNDKFAENLYYMACKIVF